MSDAITTFLDELGGSPQPLLSHVAGTIRLDIDNGGGTRHWLLDIREGAVDVSDAGAATEADASMHTHRSVFERLITGEANAVASTLRGQLSMDGNITLLVAFQRVMPGPPVAAAAGMSKTSKKGN
jgi:putative sterol carrier protein